MTDVEPRRGERVVLFVYAAVVAIAGVMGYVLGSARPRNLDPELFGLIQLPPTPLGTALYGMITVAVVLGVFLYLVAYVSRHYDSEAAD